MIPQATEWTDDGALAPVAWPRRALPRRTSEIAPVLEREQRLPRPGAGKLEAIVPVRLLMRKLGATTYRLWATLLTMRDPTCETHPALRNLAKAAGMSMQQAAKSLARLRDFKLVEDFGFMYRMVPCSCPADIGCTGHKIYVRNVYGQIRQPETTYFVAMVPAETLRLVNAAAGQGGARKGAGRPRKAAATAPSVSKQEPAKAKAEKSKGGTYKNQELVSQKSLKAFLQNTVFHSGYESASREAGMDQLNREKLGQKHSRPTLRRGFVPPLQTKAQPALPAAASDAQDAAPAAAADVASADKTRRADRESEAFVASDESCVLIDGVAHSGLSAIFAAGNAKEIGLRGTPGPRQRFTPEDVRVTTELTSRLVHLRVPAPPKVREEHSDDERLTLLKLAYRAAHEKALRTPYWRPFKPQTDTERAALLSAASVLMEEGISPVAWALHAFSMWLRVGKKQAPMPRWVWNAERIRQHASWCRDAIGPLDGGTGETLPATKELYRRLSHLQSELGWGRPTAVVVSEILPESERMALLQQQAQQLADWKKSVQQRTRSGEWVWG